MVAVSNAGSGIVSFFSGLYLTLWNFTKATVGGVYRALFIMSTVYPPAKNFLANLEHTINLVKHDPSEVKLQSLLQEPMMYGILKDCRVGAVVQLLHYWYVAFRFGIWKLPKRRSLQTP